MIERLKIWEVLDREAVSIASHISDVLNDRFIVVSEKADIYLNGLEHLPLLQAAMEIPGAGTAVLHIWVKDGEIQYQISGETYEISLADPDCFQKLTKHLAEKIEPVAEALQRSSPRAGGR